jgi:hypothetical protein
MINVYLHGTKSLEQRLLYILISGNDINNSTVRGYNFLNRTRLNRYIYEERSVAYVRPCSLSLLARVRCPGWREPAHLAHQFR